MPEKKNRTEPDPEEVYADIFDLPHWQSPVRPRMSLYDRAAQFAPFAALTGFEDVMSEEARLTESRIELSESMREDLNRRLARASALLAAGRKPVLTVVFFEPDPLKAGGRYVTLTEEIKKIDPAARRLILSRTAGRAGSNVTIDMDRILSVSGEDPEDA